MFHCFNCRAPWESSLREPAVKETCGKCGAYLHCCKNCRFHRKGYPNECYIPDTEKIADKRRANFCDEFEFRAAKPVGLATLPVDDSSQDVWGEASETLHKGQVHEDVKEWLLQSDTNVKDFDDLFEN